MIQAHHTTQTHTHTHTQRERERERERERHTHKTPHTPTTRTFACAHGAGTYWASSSIGMKAPGRCLVHATRCCHYTDTPYAYQPRLRSPVCAIYIARKDEKKRIISPLQTSYMRRDVATTQPHHTHINPDCIHPYVKYILRVRMKKRESLRSSKRRTCDVACGSHTIRISTQIACTQMCNVDCA